MENSELNPSTRVLSRSPLHAFITGPSPEAPRAKSSFNPYRKKPGILAFLGLEEVDDLLREPDVDLRSSEELSR